MFVVQFQLQGLVNTTRVRDEAAFVTCVGTTVPFRVVNQVGIPLQLRGMWLPIYSCPRRDTEWALY